MNGSSFGFLYFMRLLYYFVVLNKESSLIRFTKLVFDFQALIKMKSCQIVYY